MEISPVFEATTYAVPSPSGLYIASLTPQHLDVQYASSFETAFTFPSPASGSSTTRPTGTEPSTPSIQWSLSSSLILLTTSQNIHVFSLADPDRKVKIANGSGGLGRIAAVDVVGDDDHVLLVWEFGRVGLWDLHQGRLNEIGEVKMTGSSRSSLWAVRRTSGKPNILALISRSNAQDILSLHLLNEPTPFKSVLLPGADAQSLSWSPCGNWLCVLDSPLTSPTTFVYTPDGFLFRSHPAASVPSSDSNIPSLGPKSMHWTPGSSYLLLASSESSTVTVLSTRTFSHATILDLGTNLPEFCYQERVSAGSNRSFALLAANSIPALDTTKAVLDVRASAAESLLAIRYDGGDGGVLVWDLLSHTSAVSGRDGEMEEEQRIAPVMVLLHSAVRKMAWHPTRISLLLLITDDGGVYTFDAGVDAAPVRIESPVAGSGLDARWIARPASELAASSSADEELKICITSRKKGWAIVFPEGRDQRGLTAVATADQQTQDAVDSWTRDQPRVESQSQTHIEASASPTEEGDVSQDSLYEILSGRTPLPELKHVDHASRDAEMDETDQGLDDTFREKRMGKESEFEY
ncbi:hypothetical protein MBLNU459_g0442t1 [Dothideomycetes sp. NU459]